MPQSTEEREIKIQLTEHEFVQLESQIKKLALPEQDFFQQDIYFDTADFYLSNLNRGLRVRFNNAIPTKLEFKSLFFNPYAQINNPWYVEEISFSIPITSDHFRHLQDLFYRMDLEPLVLSSPGLSYEDLVLQFSNCHIIPMLTVTKKRREYISPNAMYVFDEISELGYFLEVESRESDPLKIIGDLGLLKEHRIVRNGYNDMIALGKPGYLSNEEKQFRFKQNQKWNILRREQELVESLLLNTKKAP